MENRHGEGPHAVVTLVVVDRPDALTHLFEFGDEKTGVDDRVIGEPVESVRVDDAIMVLQVESDMPLRFSRALGTRIPWHVSAMGKAILARSDRELAGCVAQLGELHRYTPSTITEPQRLLAELELARQRGWAINDSERWDGVRAVAVAVASDDGPARAAIGVQGPASRLPDSRLDEIVAAMRASADRLALHLQLTF